MMRAPQLTRRLVLEAPQRVADGAGGFREDWVALGEVWAEVSARSGREAARAGLPVSKMQYKITLWAAPVGQPDRPTAEQRFRDGSHVFHIRAVYKSDATGRYLTCVAQEERST